VYQHDSIKSEVFFNALDAVHFQFPCVVKLSSLGDELFWSQYGPDTYNYPKDNKWNKDEAPLAAHLEPEASRSQIHVRFDFGTRFYTGGRGSGRIRLNLPASVGVI
jgi:hypothetical protein